MLLPSLLPILIKLEVLPKIGKVGPLGLFFNTYFTMYYTSYLSNVSRLDREKVILLLKMIYDMEL